MAHLQPSVFDYRSFVPAMLLALLCLVPTLAFPISPDHAIFFFGGKTLVDGGMLYHNFVDIKPPLIYELFACIQFLLGSSELSLRLFDIVWQSCTLASLVFLLHRCGVPRIAVQIAPVIYALGYTASNFTSTLQCETLAALPLVWMLYLYIRHPERAWSWLAMGVLYGFILHLKYTFGVVVLPFLLVDIAVRRPAFAKTAGRYLLLAVGFALCTAAVYAPLLASGAWWDYLIVVDFVRTYATLHSSGGGGIATMAQALALYFANKFSLVYTACATVGIIAFLRRRKLLQPDMRLLYTLLLWESAFLLLSVVVERKFLPYHFSRMHIALAPVIAIGFAEVWHVLSSMWLSGSAGKRTAIVALSALALVATPLPRFARVSYGLALALTGIPNSQHTKSDPGESILIREDQREAAAYVLEHSEASQHTLVVSVHAAPVYFFLQPATAPMLPSSQFYIAKWCALRWKKVFAQEIVSAQWLIVQTNDRHPDITGVDATSMEWLHQQYGAVLAQRYRVDTTFSKFVVYRAIRPQETPALDISTSRDL